MRVKRASGQSTESLHAFYGSLQMGSAMLQALEVLEVIAEEVPFWGLTSMARLVLLAADDGRSEWFVKVMGTESLGFAVSWLMSPTDGPWHGAEATGRAHTLDQLGPLPAVLRDPATKDKGLQLLAWLEGVARTVPVWVAIVEEPDWARGRRLYLYPTRDSEWLVRLAWCETSHEFLVRMPSAAAPWPGLEVEGSTGDRDVACERALLAMKLSGGWPALA